MAKSPAEQIRELVPEIKVLAERDENRRKELDRANARIDQLQAETAALRQEIAVLRQRLDDHVKQVELWDGRRWGLAVLLFGAVQSLASGLVVTLARKPS